jgi:hypothetical protein
MGVPDLSNLQSQNLVLAITAEGFVLSAADTVQLLEHAVPTRKFSPDLARATAELLRAEAGRLEVQATREWTTIPNDDNQEGRNK